MAPVVGHKMKAYRNGGTVATPAWVEIAEIGDLSVTGLERGLAELKRRASDFTKNLATMLSSFSVEFRLHRGLGATMFSNLRGDFFSGATKEYAIMDGAIATSGNQGMRIPAIVSAFPWDEALEDVAGHDVRLTIAYMEDGGSEVNPSWYTVP